MHDLFRSSDFVRLLSSTWTREALHCKGRSHITRSLLPCSVSWVPSVGKHIGLQRPGTSFSHRHRRLVTINHFVQDLASYPEVSLLFSCRSKCPVLMAGLWQTAVPSLRALLSLDLLLGATAAISRVPQGQVGQQVLQSAAASRRCCLHQLQLQTDLVSQHFFVNSFVAILLTFYIFWRHYNPLKFTADTSVKLFVLHSGQNMLHIVRMSHRMSYVLSQLSLKT